MKFIALILAGLLLPLTLCAIEKNSKLLDLSTCELSSSEDILVDGVYLTEYYTESGEEYETHSLYYTVQRFEAEAVSTQNFSKELSSAADVVFTYTYVDQLRNKNEIRAVLSFKESSEGLVLLPRFSFYSKYNLESNDYDKIKVTSCVAYSAEK